MKRRVTGIGGIFLRTNDPEGMRQWYADKLGLNNDPKWGTSFEWRQAPEGAVKGYTAWNTFPQDTDYFGAADQQVMINYRVEDLDALIETLRAEGVEIASEIQSFEYGKFAHVVDPEGRRVELWEPNDDEYGKIAGSITQ
ncbi:MAG: VOC family protein [Planctomycetota bacterium]